MPAKYAGGVRYHAARLQRGALRGVLRPLASWRPMARPKAGYTVIIGALAEMPDVLRANLRLLRRQERGHLREVIVVLDRPRDALPADFEQTLGAGDEQMPLRCLYYTPTQARVLKTIGWAWCYSWLSWCIGIAACQTRYALLHDLDALLLGPNILERRYEAIRRRGHEYLGRSFYKGNGIDERDGLVVTFELMFDAAWLRRTFEPIDLFNHVGWFRGRRVEFDTFLHAQARQGRASTLPIDAEDLVHPSQVFCQYTELLNRWHYVVPEHNNLPMLPYLFHLGGNERMLARETAALRQCAVGRAMLFGRPMDVSRLSHDHLDWLITQVRRVERVVAGGLRPEVGEYFETLRQLIPGPRATPAPARAGATTIERGVAEPTALGASRKRTGPAVAGAALEPTSRGARYGGEVSGDPPGDLSGVVSAPLSATSPVVTAVATQQPGDGERAPVSQPDDGGATGSSRSGPSWREPSWSEDEPAVPGGGPPGDEDGDDESDGSIPPAAGDDAHDAGPDGVDGVEASPRVALHGVTFDAITESVCVHRVVDALDAGRGGWIITPNLDHVRRAQRDAEFRAMLAEADLVVADGMPLIWASRLQGTPLPERVAGSSMVSTLATAAGRRGRSLFLLGGEPGTAEASAKVLTARCPGLRVAGTFCPPMGFETDEHQVRQVRDALVRAQPDIVYVALGSPKQERLIRELKSALPGTWWIGVGISLSFLCGQVRRAPRWVQRLGLEWVHRLAQEPRRLARRYLLEGLPFAGRLLTGAAVNRLRGKGRPGRRDQPQETAKAGTARR